NLSQVSESSIIILMTRIGLIYSFKVLFFLGSVALSCFSLSHLSNISMLPVVVKGFEKLFLAGVIYWGDEA
ncbi:MAG: hypothetical protein WBA52_01120, partial [Dolichospermum sp.]